MEEMTCCVFTNCVFTGSIANDTTKFEDTELNDCTFSNTNIAVTLVKCTAKNCKFVKCEMKEGMIDCVIHDCQFTGSHCVIEDCSVTLCKMDEVDLTVKNSTKAIWNNVEVNRSSVIRHNTKTLENMELNDCTFSNTNIAVNLVKCTAKNCKFVNCEMKEGIIGCAFHDCPFTGSQCVIEKGCQFYGCKFDAMDLTVQDFGQLLQENFEFSGSKITTDTKQLERMDLVGYNFTSTNKEITC